MSRSPQPRIAVIADPHVHDPFADYGFSGMEIEGRRMTLRLLADSARSTRVFNESHQAFHQALDDIVAADIRHVVLLGDYSDDGQIATVESIACVLQSYEHRFGMRFFATTGNHDIFGDRGRHRAKRFMNADGTYSVVGSDAAVRDRGARAIIQSDRMYCRGYPEGLGPMASFGFFPRSHDIHWETPFGSDGEPLTRSYDVHSPDGRSTRRLMDGSYLVEPFAGVWLLMIDANVFVPVDGMMAGDEGSLADSTSAGWNAMLLHKRFILDWMQDVAGRAKAGGKALLAFSHYPVLDPLNGTVTDELALLGKTGMTERIPRIAVAEAMADAGIDIHFSGHLHVNDTARRAVATRHVINIAVPSLVAFPAAYKIVTIDEARVEIETKEIDMPLDGAVRSAYAQEIACSGVDVGGLERVADYGRFLFEHLGYLAGRRYLKRDWPTDMAALFRNATLRDIAFLAHLEDACEAGEALVRLETLRENDAAHPGTTVTISADITALDFLGDWYRLRMGSGLAMRWIGDERLAAYRAVGTLLGDRQWPQGTVQQRLSLIFRMFAAYGAGLPSENFRIDRTTGAIDAV